MIYSDPIIEKYVELIKANTSAIKAFYQGEPIRLPASNLPCAIIAKRETRAGALTNAEDEHGIGMSITIVADVRKDLSTDDNIAKAVAGVSTLYDIIEGRNEDYTLKEDSILGILRSNIVLDAAKSLRTDLGSMTRVDYGTTLRDRAQDQWSIEARIEFVCSFSQVR
ncbi:hypothetical protein GGQ85_003625 [Nitrobacter vulgaris]|uniref:hypothetical protein n=1 Tax=Nitrobacter vulgaris TaxID=29421 RepID=UPI002855D382|nr:hypothetical protein [Nitrobacter vulgaris]MDR6305899.1 hypothetical protein [Nitrobacter vulgaris]